MGLCEDLLISAQHLLDEAQNDEEHSRLLTVSTRKLGARLRALLASALGLQIDNDMVRVALGLHLGAPVDDRTIASIAQ